MLASKIQHPLFSRVDALIDTHEYDGNILNYAFHSIRNQLQVRKILIEECGYTPDCRSCPLVWTKIGATPIDYEQLKELKAQEAANKLVESGEIKASELPVDALAFRKAVRKLKRQGYQYKAHRNNDRTVSHYELTGKPKAKTPKLAGIGV